jgi:large subunit ribosomal protein L22
MAKTEAKIREFRAEAKFQRTSPQKAKLVLDMIKGLRVEQAIHSIHFSTKRMAPVVEKVLQSAIANAAYVSDEQGLDVDVDNLYVHTAIANEGPRMKRIRPAPMGRAFRYQRRTSHISISVAERHTGAAVETEDVVAAATVKPKKKGLLQRASERAAAAKKASAKKTAAKKTAAKKASAKKAPKAGE